MSADAAFDPAAHRLAEQRWFEDFRVGEMFALPSRTITEAHFSAFQAVSGDNHPIHYDRPFCARHGHKDLLAHGLQVVAVTASGAGLFPHMVDDALIAFLDQSSRFLKPVYAGDTLYPKLQVTDLKPQSTTGVLTMTSSVHNQDGAQVLEGTQRFLLRKRPAN